VNCRFCFTALLGVKRNLEAGEIVGQIAAVLRDQGVEPPRQRVNIVFMGMGEPFLNYDNFMKSVRLLVEGVGIPGVADDGFDGGNRAADLRFRARAGASEAGDFAQR